jgi:hypothetical protein
MLRQQEPYLRKLTDQQYNALTEDQLKQRLLEIHELNDKEDLSVIEMRQIEGN